MGVFYHSCYLAFLFSLPIPLSDTVLKFLQAQSKNHQPLNCEIYIYTLRVDKTCTLLLLKKSKELY